MADDFQNLVERVNEGDESAVLELIRKYESEVRIAARVLLKPALRKHLDTIDLTQSVHHALLGGLRSGQFTFSTPDKLIALAVTVLQRKVAMQWRKHYRERGHLQNRVSEREKMATETELQDDPAESVSLHEFIDMLLHRLEPVDRQIVELRMQGYTTAEAARELGLDPDVMRVRLHRLRRSLASVNWLREWL
ncbi:RNA polymerase sigma factor [Calycomorphotria hydatis]|uniref:RNA polymerase sigma factor SigD n=1 Tax=Calycomorphotria hydatis TaxID=2528027 RepID=A0A517TEJ5_9PLAN|nr:sigma-70 family RNA polymerase sigma factor [Calycomorphotria hydatis]QDT66785.1 RNA polymerase sigma factor SigD [Calycomorphotria hydatis]